MAISLDGNSLTLDDIAAVSYRGDEVRISEDPDILDRLSVSRSTIEAAAADGTDIYGVTTLFGGLADIRVDADQLAKLQRVAIWHLKSTTGPRLSTADVRATMLLRANSLMKGASGVRTVLVERLVRFLNKGAIPHVYERGSIGASGDLVPLSYIGGALLGISPEYLVDFDGETVDSHTALSRLGLEPLSPEPKEGLALVNGTGASTGIAANVLVRGMDAVSLTLGIHALFAQALLSTDQSFDPFIQSMKPHPGQIWSAARMSELLKGSKAIRSEGNGDRTHRARELIQDRYGIRCLPQFLGPIVDGFATACRQVVLGSQFCKRQPVDRPKLWRGLPHRKLPCSVPGSCDG